MPKGSRLHGGKKKCGWEIAVYDKTSARYFAFTGLVVGDRRTIRRWNPADFFPQFDSCAWDVTPPKSRPVPKPNGHSVVATNNNYELLKRGEWKNLGYPSPSEADMALVGYLAREHNYDAVKIDAAFRETGMMREKWDRHGPHGTYGRVTIDKVLADAARPPQMSSVGQFYRKEAPPVQRQLKVITLADVKAKRQEWLWPGYIPKDQLIALFGPSHTAKSIIVMDLAARVTTGAGWPDNSLNALGARKVLMLSPGEDAAETVLKPRFALAGGDPANLLIIQGSMPVGEDVTVQDEMVALDRDISLIEEYVAANPDIAMIIIDPITNHLGNLKINLEEEIRPVLMRLKTKIAEPKHIPVITIGHFNRREKGTAALDRMLGARAFSGVARTIYFTGPDNDSTEKHHFVMVQERGLGAKAWRYQTHLQSIVVDGEDCNQVKISWEGQADITGQDAVDALTVEEKSKSASAADDLVPYLRKCGGSAPKIDCIQHLFKLGHTAINESRVRRKADVESNQSNDGKLSGAIWTLKPLDSPQPDQGFVTVPDCVQRPKNNTVNSLSSGTYSVGQLPLDNPLDRGHTQVSNGSFPMQVSSGSSPNQFQCPACGTGFDTSVGRAKHMVECPSK